MNYTMNYTTRRCLTALVSILLAALAAQAQAPVSLELPKAVPPDSTDVARAEKRHFWRASAEVVGFNLGLWAFDRYVQKGDFAYISWNSIKENFKVGFKWDNDNMGTNTFLHPYNGSLYYNAGRANGFNYWQSAMFAIGGSAMWEMFMEREYPSTNDIIATPIGGTCLGEVFFRASDAVLDDRTTGMNRVGREFAGFILSPMRGFTRLVTGDIWRHRPTSGRVFGTPNVALQISAGMKTLVCRGRFKHTLVGGSLRIDLEYGDRYEIKSKKPFDYFTFTCGLQFLRNQPMLSHLSIKGRLLAREYLEEKDTHLSIGLFQHFDYYDSNTVPGTDENPYKLGIPAEIGGGILFRDVERNRWTFDAYAHFNGVILGSILSDHYVENNRNYNWASGFAAKLGGHLVFNRDKFSLTVNNEFYRLYTWVGYRTGTDLSKVNERLLNVQGDKSSAYFNVTEVTAQLRLWGNFYGSLAFTNYWRYTRYRDYPDVRSSSMALCLRLAWKL